MEDGRRARDTERVKVVVQVHPATDRVSREGAAVDAPIVPRVDDAIAERQSVLVDVYRALTQVGSPDPTIEGPRGDPRCARVGRLELDESAAGQQRAAGRLLTEGATS